MQGPQKLIMTNVEGGEDEKKDAVPIEEAKEAPERISIVQANRNIFFFICVCKLRK